MKFITTISDRDTWFFRSSTWFNRIYVNGLSGNDGAIYLNGVNLYGTLSSNANLISGLQSLSGNWEDTYTIMMQNSADWISAYTTVLANSASWEESTDISYLSGRIDSNTNDITNIGLISANWNSTYTTVNTNSGTIWIGDSAVDSLVHLNSGNWNSSYYNISNLVPYTGATTYVNLGIQTLSAKNINTDLIRSASGMYISGGIVFEKPTNSAVDFLTISRNGGLPMFRFRVSDFDEPWMSIYNTDSEMFRFYRYGSMWMAGNLSLAGSISPQYVGIGRPFDNQAFSWWQSDDLYGSYYKLVTLNDGDTAAVPIDEWDRARTYRRFHTTTSFTSSVGIGTRTPNEKLTVVGNISATGNIRATDALFDGNVGIGTSTPNKRLTIVGDISAQGTATIISSSFGTIFRAGDVSNTGFAIATDPSENLYAIGQTNISAPSGSCIFYADGYDHSAMQFRTRSSTGGSRICRFRNITDSLKLESLNDFGTTVTSSPATFSLKAPSNSFYITSAGNILLGKTTDDGINKLQVNGNIIASNLSGVNTGDQDLSGVLKTDQTIPQTTTGTFTFPNVNVSNDLRVDGKADIFGNVLIGGTTRKTYYGIPFQLEIQFGGPTDGYSYPMGFFNNNPAGGDFIFTSFADNIIVALAGDVMIENDHGGMIFAPVGDIRFTSNGGWTAAPQLRINRNDANIILCENGGNVLVNTTYDDGVNKLQVNGNIYAIGNISGANLVGINTGDQDLSTINSQITTMGSVSANWNSTYTTVQTNSATTWNYQGTDLKALSGNWQSAYNSISGLVPYSGATANVDIGSHNLDATEGNFDKVNISGDRYDSTLKVGTLEFQNYSLNNSWFGDNIYYIDGTGFVRRTGGANAGQFHFQGNEGQFRFFGQYDDVNNQANPVQMKMSSTGEWGIGGGAGNGINSPTGDFTGAQVYKDAYGNMTFNGNPPTYGSAVAKFESNNSISFTDVIIKNSNPNTSEGQAQARIRLQTYDDLIEGVLFGKTTFGGPYGGFAYFWNTENSDFAFATNNAEKMRLTAGGNLLLGSSSDDGYSKLQVNASTNYGFNQTNGKFLVNSTNGSFGQFQIVNPTDGEVTLVLAANSIPDLSTGGITNNYSDGGRIWAFGLGCYGTPSNYWTFGNNEVGGPVMQIGNRGFLRVVKYDSTGPAVEMKNVYGSDFSGNYGGVVAFDFVAVKYPYGSPELVANMAYIGDAEAGPGNSIFVANHNPGDIPFLCGGTKTYVAYNYSNMPVNDGFSALQVNGSVNATGYYANGTPPVADGTYTMGFGATQNGTITVVGGIITAVTEAAN